MFNGIFNFNPDLSDLISGGLNMIMQKIFDEIQQPLLGLVGEVSKGRWKGRGADKFLAEMNGDMNNALNMSHNNVDQLRQQINQVVGIMNQGMSSANGLANTIQGLFDSWS